MAISSGAVADVANSIVLSTGKSLTTSDTTIGSNACDDSGVHTVSICAQNGLYLDGEQVATQAYVDAVISGIPVGVNETELGVAISNSEASLEAELVALEAELAATNTELASTKAALVAAESRVNATIAVFEAQMSTLNSVVASIKGDNGGDGGEEDSPGAPIFLSSTIEFVLAAVRGFHFEEAW